jgi:hypothetical protein
MILIYKYSVLTGFLKVRAGAIGPSGLQIYLLLCLLFIIQAKHLSGKEGLLAPARKTKLDSFRGGLRPLQTGAPF